MSVLAQNLTEAWEQRAQALLTEATLHLFLKPERVQAMFWEHSRALEWRRYWAGIGAS
jgi:hypothetical protein